VCGLQVLPTVEKLTKRFWWDLIISRNWTLKKASFDWKNAAMTALLGCSCECN